METNIDDFFVPEGDDHPALIAARVMRYPEHQHLIDNEIDIEWLMRRPELVKGGKVVLGTVHEPNVQGSLRDVFKWMLEKTLGRLPRFLIVLDWEFWSQADDATKEILVFHELAHISQRHDKYGAPRFDKDGQPVYGLTEHDVNEFTSVVARYGAWNEDIQNFLEAARRHGE